MALTCDFDDRQRVEGRARLEAAGERDCRRAGVPWRENARPGVLGPAGRGDVEMHVDWHETQSVIVDKCPIGY